VTQDWHPDYIWSDGRLVPWDEATIHLTQAHWSAIGAVFEGIKAYRNPQSGELYIFRLREHLRRLGQSMKMAGLKPVWSEAELERAVLEVLRSNNRRDDTYIQPVAYPIGPGRAFSRADEVRTGLYITIRPFESHLLTDYRINVRVSSWVRIADNVMPPRIKAIPNYWNSRLATREAQADGYDGAIILNTAGKVAEGPGACLFIVREGVAITPPVTASILESITRATVIVLLRELLGVPVIEREVDRTELYVCDEAFFCGTAAEITPIASVDRFPVGDGEVGPVTRRLQQVYHDIIRGIDGRFAEWRTPVGTARPAVAGG
jgi:branched-chain amino acid aminotransferase